MEARIIKVGVEGRTTLALDDLNVFQGELKRLERPEYEQMMANFKKHGIRFTLSVWKNPEDDKWCLLDGHQRKFTLTKMRDEEGYEIPRIPVSIVHADSYNHAKELVLAGTAQYGTMTEQSLFNYCQENGFTAEHIAGAYKYAGIEAGKFLNLFNPGGTDEKKSNEEGLPETTPEMRSAGNDVKQVQLYFDATTHAEFMDKVSDLSKWFGKDNITDTIVEVVRATHKANLEG